MISSSASELYRNHGFVIKEEKTIKSDIRKFAISASAIPAAVVDSIRKTPLRGQINITNNYRVTEKILRCDTLILNPESVLSWHINPTIESVLNNQPAPVPAWAGGP